MTIEETLYSLLGSVIPLYPLEKPEKITTLAAVYERLSTSRQRIENAKSSFNRVRMAITVYGPSYSAVKTAVSTINGLMDENITNFTLSILTDQKDFKDPDSRLFYTYLEYFIFAHAE